MDAAPKKKLLRKPRKPLTKALVKPEQKVAARLPQKRHDWNAARAFFVERMDNVTLKDVADTFGINYDNVRARSASERWPMLKQDFQTKAAVDMAKTRIKRLMKDGEAFDDQALQAAKLGMGLIAGRLAQVSQLFAATQQTYASAVARMRQGLPVQKEELYGAFYAKDMTELARSLELFQKVGKLAIGIDPTNINPQDLINKHEAATHEDEDVSIEDELRKPDMDRLAAIMEAMERMGVATLLAPDGDDEDVSGSPPGTVLTDNMSAAVDAIGETTEETQDQPAA